MPAILRSLALLGLGATPALVQFALEPQGLRRGETPSTLRGATVIDARQHADLLATRWPLMIDAANLPHRPEGRVATVPVHGSVPGRHLDARRRQGHARRGLRRARRGGHRRRQIEADRHVLPPAALGSWNAQRNG